MRRRAFLAAGGAGFVAALAGCVGSSRETLEERPPENEVVDQLRTAVGTVNVAAIELAAAGEGVDPAEVEVDEAALSDRIATAREQLDAAANHEAADELDRDLSAHVASLRSYVDVVEVLLDGTVDLTGVAEELLALEDALADEAFDAAESTLTGVRPTVEEVRTAVEEAAATADDLDAERLEPYGALVEEIRDGVDDLGGLAAGADELTAGYLAVVEGYQHLDEGRAASEDRDFEAAAAAFAEAGTAFGDATERFEAGQGEAEDLDAEFETALCRSGHLETAAGHFQASAEAADQGDPMTARDEREQAEAALERTNDC